MASARRTVSGPDRDSLSYTQTTSESSEAGSVLNQYELDDFSMAVYLELRDQPDTSTECSASNKI